MQRPLAILAAVYAGGIVAADSVHVPLPFLFLAGLTITAVAFAIAKWRPYLVCLALLLAGWTNLTWRADILSPHDVRLVFGREPELVRGRGVLASDPSERRYERLGREYSRTLASVALREVESGGTWSPVHGIVLVTTPGSLGRRFIKGTVVELEGVIHSPQPALAPGLFDYKVFLRRQGIHFQMEVRNPDQWRVIEQERRFSVANHFFNWAQSRLQLGLPQKDESLHLLWAMTLGWRPGLTDELSEPFMRSGTMHIFAISGLHIALIAGIIVALLRVLQIPRPVCGVIVIPLLWFYTAATGWQPSAIRSTVMMTVVIGGWALRRPGDLLNSLGAAALIILLWDPQQLFQASFQLSFFVVFSLAILMPRFEKLRQTLFAHDPFLPDELRPRWKRLLDGPVRWTTTLFATSLAAWIGSLPLTALYFHLFTPVSLLANMVVVPLSGFALMSSLGSFICGAWQPWLTVTFNHSAWFFMAAMNAASGWFSRLPGAYWNVRSPSQVECLLYYGLAFAVLAGPTLNRRLRMAIVASIVILAGIWVANGLLHRNDCRLTVLPLSGGEALFIDEPGKGEDLLVDCGSNSSVEFVTKPFLQGQGINRLPKLILTHGDLRSAGGATNIIDAFRPGQIVTSPIAFRSPAYRSLRQWLDREVPERKHEVARNDRLGRWTVLHPMAGEKFAQADDGCMVLRGSLHSTTFLMLGDLSRAGQELLLQRSEELQADVVIAGIPRDSEPLCEALLEAIRPRLVIITDSQFPAPERATPVLRSRLSRCGVPVLYCRDTGAVTFDIGLQDCRIRTALPSPEAIDLLKPGGNQGRRKKE